MKLNRIDFIYLFGMFAIAIFLMGLAPGATTLHRDLPLPGNDKLTSWLNISIIISSFFLMLFMLGLAFLRNGWQFKLLSLFGVIAALAQAGIGLFPATEESLHSFFLLSFFCANLVLTLGFTLITFSSKNPPWPKWIAWLSLSNFVALLLFFSLPTLLYPELGLDVIYSPRNLSIITPMLWLPALLEWMVIITTTCWLACLTINLPQAEVVTISD